MRTININEYNPSMGRLISVEAKEIYNQQHIEGSINIPFETLLYNREKLLNKEDTYYIYCNGGHKSKRIVNILEIYGYKVVQVLLNNSDVKK